MCILIEAFLEAPFYMLIATIPIIIFVIASFLLINSISYERDDMSIMLPDEITRSDMSMLIDAIDCYYMSSVELTEDQEKQLLSMKSSLTDRRNSDFDICMIESYK